MGDAAPQPAQLVRVHAIVGAGDRAAGELGPEEVPDPLLHLLEADVAVQRVLLQQHGQQQGHVLEGGALVVAVLVEDERGAGGQQLEAVNDRGSAPGVERRAQLPVHLLLGPVAVEPGFVPAVDLHRAAVQGGRVGVGQAGAEAAQGPLGAAGGREDDDGRLRVLGRVQVLAQELAPTEPQVGALAREPVLQLVELGQERLHRGVLAGLLGAGGGAAEAEYAEAEHCDAHDEKPCSAGERWGTGVSAK